MVRACILLLFVAFVSCKGGNKNFESKYENGGDEVYGVKNEDKEMNAAIAEAIRTWPEFEKVMQAGDTSLQQFTVKMRFSYEGDNGEHMWLNDLHYKEGQLMGVLNSDPMYVESVKWGDTLKIQKDSVSDWMYIKNGKLIGGYTIRALYKKMSKEEQEQFKSEISFGIE